MRTIPESSCLDEPEHADQSWDSSRLEDGEQTLPLMGQVVKDAGCGSSRLHVTGVLHGSHHRSHHLRGLHERTAGCLFACELVDDLGSLADHHLMENHKNLYQSQ